MLVTSQLLWFGVNFCMLYDFSSCMTSLLCLLRLGLNFCMLYDFSSCFFFENVIERLKLKFGVLIGVNFRAKLVNCRFSVRRVSNIVVC